MCKHAATMYSMVTLETMAKEASTEHYVIVLKEVSMVSGVID